MIDTYTIILICAIPLVLVVSFFAWEERREKEKHLEERIAKLEEELK